MSFLGGKLRGLLAYLAIAALLLGGLGWATRAALRVEDEHRMAAANSFRAEQLFHGGNEAYQSIQRALGRLDARVTPALSREDSRPYPHYAAMHSPFTAMDSKWLACPAGEVYLPSPLLTAKLPEWIRLHFQVDETYGWTSPQVISDELCKALRKQPLELALNNVTADRADLIRGLNTAYPGPSIMATFREMGVVPAASPEEAEREEQQRIKELVDIVNSAKVPGRGNYANDKGAQAPPMQTVGQGGQFQNNDRGNTINPQVDFAGRELNRNRARRDGLWAYIFDDNRANLPAGVRSALPRPSDDAPKYRTVDIQLGEMRPIWLPSAEQPDHLLLVRGVKEGRQTVYQGFAIDWPKLQLVLQDEVEDQFPGARFVPLPPGEPPHPDRAMTALPIEFDPVVELNVPPEVKSVEELPPAGWTPLRIGLAIAWIAVFMALAGVGLGGWTLIDLSERRIRFVSAVTHELRTPLTTLRLYLDLLSSGMVTEETQKAEYLKTLDAEADRLHRLIGNVLDFARLEKSHPAVAAQTTPVANLLGQLHRTWHERCAAAGKDLVIENTLHETATVCTDPGLAEQIVSNLIDNAQKYSRDATDPKIVLRARELEGRLAIEVEDRGPGVTKRERCSIFRPFRRGHDADVKAGGVGLGLALATRWAQYIGGRLSVATGPNDVGACFRLEIPGLGA
jgi:signal transduction histidine kinase